MKLNRLFTTAAVAALIACPVAALAQPAAAPATAAPAAAAPAPEAAAPALPPSPNLVPAGNLVATLKASGHFTILVKAIEATNLSATLSTVPNLTLFAPTDEAFRALPAGQLDRLMLPANAPLLQKIVIYHLFNGPVPTSQLRGTQGALKMVENTEVKVDGMGEAVRINDADIIQADVRATNGLIHVIDKVLIPSDAPIAASVAAPLSSGR